MENVKKVKKIIITDDKFKDYIVVLLSFYDNNDVLVLSEKHLTIDGSFDLDSNLNQKTICCKLKLDGLIIE